MTHVVQQQQQLCVILPTFQHVYAFMSYDIVFYKASLACNMCDDKGKLFRPVTAMICKS